jgi:Co/Zn/Cd efflux system component
MMQKSVFLIRKMDCPSEEQMIRMKLDSLVEIKNLEFDIPGRKLAVIHTGGHERILATLETLNFNTSFVESGPADGLYEPEDSAVQRKLLWQVLAINFFFFILEMTTGFLAGSMGLMADSLDMLADSFVYGLALLAVGAAVATKNRVARVSGFLQMALAVIGMAETIRRFTGTAIMPEFSLMIGISLLALIGNVTCLWLLQRSKSREAHMQASVIFTSNDVVVNLGVILAGGLVFLTASRYPDLIVGTIVFGIVVMGAVRIFKVSNTTFKTR